MTSAMCDASYSRGLLAKIWNAISFVMLRSCSDMNESVKRHDFLRSTATLIIYWAGQKHNVVTRISISSKLAHSCPVAIAIAATLYGHACAGDGVVRLVRATSKIRTRYWYRRCRRVRLLCPRDLSTLTSAEVEAFCCILNHWILDGIINTPTEEWDRIMHRRMYWDGKETTTKTFLLSEILNDRLLNTMQNETNIISFISWW